MFSLIQHIVVTLLSRSKTVVEFFPIAAICRILPNKSNPEHVLYPLPWQTNKTLIISKILPVKNKLPVLPRHLTGIMICMVNRPPSAEYSIMPPYFSAR